MPSVAVKKLAGISSRDAFGGTYKPINYLNDQRNHRSVQSESAAVTWTATTNKPRERYSTFAQGNIITHLAPINMSKI